jgi:hypothetical protein
MKSTSVGGWLPPSAEASVAVVLRNPLAYHEVFERPAAVLRFDADGGLRCAAAQRYAHRDLRRVRTGRRVARTGDHMASRDLYRASPCSHPSERAR